MRRSDYRHLTALRRPPATPAITYPTTPRLDAMAELRHALDATTADLPVVDLGDRGRHYPHTVQTVPSDWMPDGRGGDAARVGCHYQHLVDQDWSPLRPGERQTLAPHHYADRYLPADACERTGLLDLDAITTAGEVTV